MSEIEHEYTHDIVCPYCGHKFDDSWEYGDIQSGMEIECDKCDKTFRAYSIVDISYSTEKIND